MTDLLRQEIAAVAETVVVKVGTRVLTHPDGTLNEDRIAILAEELSEVRRSGRHVALVSSGAVGAGMSQLGLSQRPTDVAQLQAVAAIGQTKLIEAYDRTFRKTRPPRRSSPAHGRRPGRSSTLPERPQHAADAAAIRRHSDHQRKRHGGRGRIDDHFRRQ